MNLAHARQSFALFDDLLDRAFIAARNDRDARPSWIETLTNRDRFNIEASGAEQPDDPRQLAGLISNNYRQRMPF